MFETEIHEDRSVVAFLIQQLAVWIISVIWALITASLPVWLSQFGPVARMFGAASVIGLASAPAFFGGRLIQYSYPHFAVSGRWVWVVPSIFLLALLVVFVIYTHEPLSRNLADLFSPRNDLGSVLAALFVTYPTLGCVGYSVGIRVEHRKRVSE